MLQWYSIRPHCGDCSDDKRKLPPVFSGVQCGCECVTLTWVSSLSNQYHWGSISPPEALSWFIRIHVQWPFVTYGQHSLETCQVLYLQKEIIVWEPTRGSLSTISPNIDEWRASTWWDFTTCRLGSTWAIKVWLQSEHLNGHRWAYSTNLSTHRQYTWCTTTWRYSRQRNYIPPEAWSALYPWSDKGEDS